MSHIFISYSRKDLELARPVVVALAKDNLDVWIDWEDIPKGEEFVKEIYQGIEGADAFLFLVSPDSVQSEWCNKEIDHAVKNGKRILPIVIRDTDPKAVHPEIANRNWIFCRDEQDDFNKAIEEARKTIQTDYEWSKYHTELQVKALKWEQKKDNSRLLRGKELREAEQQLASAGSKEDPQPTELQRLYMSKSRGGIKKLNRWMVSLAMAIVTVIVILVLLPYLRMEPAISGNWVSIPDGEFTMGMNQVEADTAEHLCKEFQDDTVEFCLLTEDLLMRSGRQINAELPEFQIMDNEVTNAQYVQCVDTGECIRPDGWDYESVDINKPATGLNWQEAMIYCQWLGGRLPTEGEWEKAARGPNQTYFPWGNNWDPLEQRANLENTNDASPQSVAIYATRDTNEYHVSNMAGNVMEWTASPSSPHNISEIFTNEEVSLEEISQIVRVIVRGGAWDNPSSSGMASNRGALQPTFRDARIGFRCACPNGQICESPWNRRWIWSHDYYPDQ